MMATGAVSRQDGGTPYQAGVLGDARRAGAGVSILPGLCSAMGVSLQTEFQQRES